MCGIAGYSLSTKEQVDTELLTMSLMLDIEHRGRDATGIAWYEDGAVWYRKENVTAEQFIISGEHNTPGRTVIIHTRAATQGRPEMNVNNHPIITEHIAGVHNGIIMNDKAATKMLNLTRGAEVDSEVIFRILDNKTIDKVGTALEGDAAIAWLDSRDKKDTLHLAALGGRPLWFGTTTNGSLLFASTLEAVEGAAKCTGMDLNHVHNMADGRSFTVVDGEMGEVLTVPEIDSPFWNKKYQAQKGLANGPGVIKHTPAYTPWTPPAKSQDFRGVPFDEMYDDQFHFTPVSTTVAEYDSTYQKDEFEDEAIARYETTHEGRDITVILYENDGVMVRDTQTTVILDYFESIADFNVEFGVAEDTDAIAMLF